MPPPYSRLCDIILSPCMISSLCSSPAVTPASGAVLCSQHILRIRLPLGSSPINQQLISPVRGQEELLSPTLCSTTLFTLPWLVQCFCKKHCYFYNLCNH